MTKNPKSLIVSNKPPNYDALLYFLAIKPSMISHKNLKITDIINKTVYLYIKQYSITKLRIIPTSVI